MVVLSTEMTSTRLVPEATNPESVYTWTGWPLDFLSFFADLLSAADRSWPVSQRRAAAAINSELACGFIDHLARILQGAVGRRGRRDPKSGGNSRAGPDVRVTRKRKLVSAG